MSFSSLQKLVTYGLAALGLLALSFGGELPLVSLGLLAAGFAASWFAEGELIHSSRWSRGWTALLVVMLGLQMARGFFWQEGWLSLAMEFAGLLTISRLASRRNAADYQQVAMLAFIQLIAATVLTTDVGYALLFVAFVVVTPWALTLAHLRREIERNYPVESEARGGTDLARVLASKRIVGLPFLLWTLLLSVPMLAMTLGLFVIFPRVGLGVISIGNSRGQHVSGFGNNVELGSFGVIRDDPTVVARVTPDREMGAKDELNYLRLRGTAFDQYDGRRWTRSEGELVPMSAMGEYYALKRLPRPGDRTFKIILERIDEPVLFLPHGTVGVRIPYRGLPGSGRKSVTLTRGHGLDLRYRSTEDIGIIYDVIVGSQPADLDVPVARDMDDERYLSLPPGHERVYKLARELTADLSDPAQKAARLLRHLRDGRYTYTTDMPNTGDKPPLEVFLFEARRGHCEYFATALAVMLRAVGIPSRNVTGFVGGRYNRYGGYFAIRQSDAHSWVEAHLPGRGWVTFDATPAGREELESSDWLLRDLSAAVDALRAYWMMRVVGYDLRTQARLLTEVRAFLREIPWPDFGGSGGRDRQESEAAGAKTEQLGRIGGHIALGLALLVITLLVVRALRKRRPQRALSDSALRARKLYVQLEQVLANKGRARPPHVSPEAHARALELAGFPAAEAVQELTRAYAAARYGRAALPEETLRSLEQRLDEVKRAA